MKSNVVKLLLGLAVIFLIILLLEWAFSQSVDELLKEPESSAEMIQNQEMQLPELILAKQALESYSDMVDNPLFIEGRKPVINNESDSSAPVDLGNIDDLNLVGIYSVDGRKHALFSGKGKDGKYSKKTEGEDVSGWMITEIKTDAVILEQNNKQQTMLLRKPKPAISKGRSGKKRSSIKKPTLKKPKRRQRVEN